MVGPVSSKETDVERLARFALASDVVAKLEELALEYGLESTISAARALARFWDETAMADPRFGPQHAEENLRIVETTHDVLVGLIDTFHAPEMNGDEWKNEN